MAAQIPPKAGEVIARSRIVLGWQALLPCRPQPSFEKLWAQSSTYISQANRAQGIGRALLSFACKSAIQSGLSVIIGYVRAGNAAPLKIVESLGWKRVGSIPRANGCEPELFCYAYAVPTERKEAENKEETFLYLIVLVFRAAKHVAAKIKIRLSSQMLVQSNRDTEQGGFI